MPGLRTPTRLQGSQSAGAAAGPIGSDAKSRGGRAGVYSVYDGPVNSRDLISELKADGWRLVRVNGSHHMFQHATKVGTIVVPHPKKDLGKGLLKAIRRAAGL